MQVYTIARPCTLPVRATNGLCIENLECRQFPEYLKFHFFSSRILVSSDKVSIQVPPWCSKLRLPWLEEHRSNTFASAGAAIRCSFCGCDTLSEMSMFEKTWLWFPIYIAAFFCLQHLPSGKADLPTLSPATRGKMMLWCRLLFAKPLKGYGAQWHS